MLPGGKTPHSRLKDGTADYTCCTKHQSAKKYDVSNKLIERDEHGYCTFLAKNNPMFIAVAILSLVIATCILSSIIYAMLIAEWRYGTKVIDKTIEAEKYSANEELFFSNDAEVTTRQDTSTDNSKQLSNEDILQDLHRNFYEMISDDVRKRIRRDTELRECKLKVEHCKAILESMQNIAKIVNSSMPQLQTLLTKNGSKIIELVKCLECKNMENPATTVRYSEKSEYRNDSSDSATMRYNTHNMQAVKILIDKKQENIEKKKDNLTDPGVIKDDESLNNHPLTVNELHGGSSTTLPDRNDTKVTATDTNSRPNPTTGVPVITNTENSATIGANTTDTTYQPNVTAITSTEAVHPSISPIDERHTEILQPGSVNVDPNKGKLDNSGRASATNEYSKILTNSKYEEIEDSAPTAETTKSSQQLQLNPSMSWMPYPVCFYGYPPSGQARQPFLGPYRYPVSSPTAPYAASGPQHRGQPFPAQSAGSNYVQVQAHSVQLMPMQTYPGALPQDMVRGQRVGPTGTAFQNMPVNPAIPTGGSGASARMPYYCTYIPTPTFQFPTVPGISSYQRKADENDDYAKYIASLETNKIWNPPNPINSGLLRKCPTGYHQCADGSNCISRLKWCDGVVHCADASDETTCSCRDRIAKDRLCDGYFDCPHGEDELGCFGCPKRAFSCGEWNKHEDRAHCVLLSERCDGIKQCTNGKDEMDCHILTPNYIEGQDVFTVGYTEGYLHRNFRGQWYPACRPAKSWATEACISETGPDVTNEPPYVEEHYVYNNGPYIIATDKGGTKIVNSCDNLAVYVRCPGMTCGTRLINDEESSFYYQTNNIIASRSSVSQNKTVEEVETDPKVSGKVLDEGLKTDANGKNDSIVGVELRVVGGRASQPKAWPFLVAIYRNGVFHCGGAILNQYWILTAAHCVDGYEKYYYEVQAGILRRFSFSPMAQSRRAKRVVRHPNYNRDQMINDIAMIMLDEPLGFNRWVRPACLPEAQTAGPMWRQGPPADTTCVAMGWGATQEHGPDPDHLREVEVPILPYCKHPVDRNDAEICAGFPQGGRDACQGDSGGPLMCRNPNFESQWYVAGIVSHGEGCGRPDEPGAYTKVSYFVTWIQEIARDTSLSSVENMPLNRCPGLSCEGGLGTCLPIEKHCDNIVDCLDADDEKYCFGSKNQQQSNNYRNFQQWTHADVNDTIINSTTSSPGNDSSTEITETPTTIDESFTRESTTSSKKLITLDIIETTEKQQITKKYYTTENIKEMTSESTTTISTPIKNIIFTCTKLLQIISIEKKCDKIFDCEDGTDEIDCTCKDYLSSRHPLAICDGRIDCTDGSDEENCEICTKDEFLCSRSRTCIPSYKKCDFKNDCPLSEDEEDCYTLSNGMYVNMDPEGRSYLHLEGIFTSYENDKWRSVCHSPYEHNNESTAVTIGRNMCLYFGYANVQSVNEIETRDVSLPMRSSAAKEKTRYEDSSMQIAVAEDEKTCPGLYVRCRPVLNSDATAYLFADPRTGSRGYRWPWSAAIFVDGRYHCSAILLEPDWLLSTANCINDVSLHQNYTTALLGMTPSLWYVDGPHQQVSVVDDMKIVQNFNVSLLHLRTATNRTRYVQPLYLEKKIYPASYGDQCVAFGTNGYNETKSIFVRPVLKDCEKCDRCFINESIPECQDQNNNTVAWSGIVVCHGLGGWYPAAVFTEINGLCSFKTSRSLESIDYINAHLIQAMDEKLRQFEQPVCNGFRCNLGECISQQQTCNGIRDCQDGADEDTEFCQDKEEMCVNDIVGCKCARSELRCANGECVSKSAFCNGVADCSDGTDEPSVCTCAEYLKLIAPERICDGVWHCLDKTDESPDQCLCKDASFKCKKSTENSTCIPQDFVCDGEKDCPHGEDEDDCRRIKGSLKDSNGTGEVIRRSYGVWHSECFSTPMTSPEEVSSLCQSLGYTSGRVMDNPEDIKKPPVVPSRDKFYVVRLHDDIWVTMRDDKPLIKLVETEKCNRLFLQCS